MNAQHLVGVKRNSLAQNYKLTSNQNQRFEGYTQKQIDREEIRNKKEQELAKIELLESHIKKQSKQFTDNQDVYLDKVIKQLTDRGLPTKTVKSIMAKLNNLEEGANNSLKVIDALEKVIPDALLKNHYAEKNITSTGKSEVVLSMYLH